MRLFVVIVLLMSCAPRATYRDVVRFSGEPTSRKIWACGVVDRNLPTERLTCVTPEQLVEACLAKDGRCVP